MFPCVCMYIYLLGEIYACVYEYVCAHVCMYVCMCRFVYLLKSSTEKTNIFYPHEDAY